MKTIRSMILCLVMLAGALLPGQLYAQAAGNAYAAQPSMNTLKYNYSNIYNDRNGSGDANNNSIVLDADVMINVRASSYVAVFSAIQRGETVGATDSMMTKRLNTFMALLKKEGIEEKDIHTDFISLIPTYNVEVESKIFSTTANEMPTGFEMKKNVHILFRKHRALDAIITGAAKAEIYDLVKVDYNVDKIMNAYDTLRTQARKIIDQKKEIYAKMGLDTKVINLTEGYNCAYPVERYASYTAYRSGISRSDAKKVNQQNVPVNEQQKNTTVYYNMVPYNQFDMVVNADNVEPVVQFYYKLKVRFEVSMKKEKPSATAMAK